MRNQDIRELIKSSGLKMWQIAEAYGISDSNFSRKLRYEFSNDEKMKIYNIIEKLTKHR